MAAAAALAIAGGSFDSFAASSEAKQNWPQWRGPLNSGEAPEGNPPVEWSEEKNVKWKVKLPGHGASTPIVWKDMVLIQAAIPTGKKVEGASAAPGQGQAPAAQQGQGQSPGEGRRRGGPGGPGGPGGGFGGRGQKPTEFHQFVVLAYDRNSGKELWRTTVKEEVPHEGHHQDHGYSSYSPVTDGEHIVVLFGSRGLYGLDMKGKVLWEKDLGHMNTKMGFGEGSSPALHGKTVVVNWDHEGEDFIAAFDKTNGKELWRQKREEDTTWATPLVVEHNGKAQVVTAGTKKVRTYDLQTGEMIWESPGLTPNAIPSPVAQDGVVYVMSGFRGAALYAIKFGAAKGDIANSDAIVWSHAKNTPYVPSPLLHQDKLYFFSGNKGILSVFDAKTGKALVDAERLEAVQNVYSSPVAAKDRIYLVSREGATAVAKVAGEKLEIVKTNKLDDGFDASPAIAGNELFLRGRQYLYCLAEK